MDSGALSVAVNQVGIGIDPGLGAKRCGLAAIYAEPPRVIDVHSVGPEPWDEIRRFVTTIAQHHALSFIAIENPLRVLAGKHQSGETNVKAWRLLEIVGFARALAALLHVAFIDIDPQRIKRAVGAPSDADKKQVLRCVQACFRSDRLALNEHEADALATAYSARAIHRMRLAGIA
jgi:Holliday junction resolvasome RuvABC endonuclease subunit